MLDPLTQGLHYKLSGILMKQTQRASQPAVIKDTKKSKKPSAADFAKTSKAKRALYEYWKLT